MSDQYKSVLLKYYVKTTKKYLPNFDWENIEIYQWPFTLDKGKKSYQSGTPKTSLESRFIIAFLKILQLISMLCKKLKG